jgi:hypothetical protein
VRKFIFWAPRVLTIIFILFLSLFALDSFDPGQPIPYMIVAFLIHLIPCYILAAVLIISWKRELVAAVVFPILGILYMIVSFKNVGFIALSWSIIISGPAFIIGVLFLLNWKIKVRSNKK